MKMPRQARVALLAAAALLAGPASAAMYRCGNAFQDRPCDDSAQQQLIKPGRGGAAPQPVAPAVKAPAPPAPEPAAPVAPAKVPVAAPASPGTMKAGSSPICANLREQLDAVQARTRTSTRPATLSLLQRQQQELEKNLADARC